MHAPSRILPVLLPLVLAACAHSAPVSAYRPGVLRAPALSSLDDCLVMAHEELAAHAEFAAIAADRQPATTFDLALEGALRKDPDRKPLVEAMARVAAIPVEAARIAVEPWTTSRFHCAYPDRDAQIAATVTKADAALRLAPTSVFLLDLDARVRALYLPHEPGEVPGYAETLRSTKAPGEAALTAAWNVAWLSLKDRRALLALAKERLPRHVLARLLEVDLSDRADPGRAEGFLEILGGLKDREPSAPWCFQRWLARHAFVAAGEAGRFRRSAEILDGLPARLREALEKAGACELDEDLDRVRLRLTLADSRMAMAAVRAVAGQRKAAEALRRAAAVDTRSSSLDPAGLPRLVRFLIERRPKADLFEIAVGFHADATGNGDAGFWRGLLEDALERAGYRLHARVAPVDEAVRKAAGAPARSIDVLLLDPARNRALVSVDGGDASGLYRARRTKQGWKVDRLPGAGR